jgi:hypothetical protein
VGQVLGEEDGQAFAVRGPARLCEQTLEVSDLAGVAAFGGGDVELQLLLLFAVREEGDLFAVGREGNGVFVAGGFDAAGPGGAPMRMCGAT